jgi:hypothetical protein
MIARKPLARYRPISCHRSARRSERLELGRERSDCFQKKAGDSGRKDRVDQTIPISRRLQTSGVTDFGRKAVASRAASCRENSRKVWGKVWGSWQRRNKLCC